ncbi:tail fiber assembly protein [Stutzerimonas kirkiae]|uniref:tail fiber assembly protein n=1 Tax=Stutzerimonas kirkiae TaxID=2211392 RepID=UPI001F607D8A|nr:tail fiber assembly protein [Stutzerimonas kirkiae]
MTILFSASTTGFYDTRVHGERTLLIVDPNWARPLISVPLQPGEALPDGSFINETDEPITLDVPDATAEPVLIEVPNESCMLPIDAVEITAERHAELLAGNASGKLIVPDDDGRPTLTDPLPPTAEQLAASALAKRSNLLQVATQAIAPLQDAVDLGDASAEEEAALLAWKRYRVALNRIEQQDGYPATIEWPVNP